MSINNHSTHQLKRLQPNVSYSSLNHHQSSLPNDEAIRESIQNFTVRPVCSID